MKTYTIIYTIDAIEDLRYIHHYIAFEQDACSIADRLMNEICAIINNLKVLPRRCPLVEISPWKERDTRKLFFKNYFVFYQIDDKKSAIYILRILSCRQDIYRINAD